MTDAMINEKVLAWAVDRAEIPLDVVAKKVNVKPERIATWIEGEERPTFRQAQSLSSALHIPFGYLFLKEPRRKSSQFLIFEPLAATRRVSSI